MALVWSSFSETLSHCFFYETDLVFKFEHLVGWLVEDVDIAHPVHTLDLVVLVYSIEALLVLFFIVLICRANPSSTSSKSVMRISLQSTSSRRVWAD